MSQLPRIGESQFLSCQDPWEEDVEGGGLGVKDTGRHAENVHLLQFCIQEHRTGQDRQAVETHFRPRLADAFRSRIIGVDDRDV